MKKTMMMAATMAMAVPGTQLAAQVRIQTTPGAFAWVVGGDPDRPMIGVSTRSSGGRDTLGLLVESVTRDGPAAKAGIEEGDRLVSVNGVNLRLSPADAGEDDMEGVANRRLIRELEKHDAGDEVELRVYRDGATRTVRLKTVAASELAKANTFTSSVGSLRRELADRAVLGVSLGGTGSRRDTSGILVVGVTDDGPAAKAGLDEGDRIASINDVDLRVAREDAGDWQAANARRNRLTREMEKVKPGDTVELRVVTNGQSRTVRVEAGKATDVGPDGGAFMFDNFSGTLRSLRGVESIPGTLRLRRGASDEVVPERRLQELLRSAEERIKASTQRDRRVESLEARPLRVITTRKASAG